MIQKLKKVLMSFTVFLVAITTVFGNTVSINADELKENDFGLINKNEIIEVNKEFELLLKSSDEDIDIEIPKNIEFIGIKNKDEVLDFKEIDSLEYNDEKNFLSINREEILFDTLIFKANEVDTYKFKVTLKNDQEQFDELFITVTEKQEIINDNVKMTDDEIFDKNIQEEVIEIETDKVIVENKEKSLSQRTITPRATELNVVYLPVHYQAMNGNHTFFGQVGRITIPSTGEIAFCIDPYTPINGAEIGYVGQEMTNGYVPGNLQDKFSIWTYFYRTELNTNDWYSAIQLLIWQDLTGLTYTSITGLNHDLNWYRTELNKKVNNFNTVPSFDNQSIKLKVGESITLTDTNGVLSNFKTPSLSGFTFTQSGNKLTIKATAVKGKTSVTSELNIPDIYKGTPMVYLKPNSQTIGKFLISDPNSYKISLEAEQPLGHVKITKTNADTGAKVQNAEFEISKNKSTILDTKRTNANGELTFNDLMEGTYYYREKSVPSPYIVDTTWKSVTVVGGTTTSKTETNEVAKGKIVITKENEKGVKIPNTTYDVKNSSGNVIATITTNSNGVAEITDLPLGRYTVIEKSVPSPYIVDTTPISIDITYKNQTTPIVSVAKTQVNKVAKGKIILTKKESPINNPEFIDQVIKGTEFKLYANSQIVELGSVIYNNGELIDTLTTDENGQIIIENLPLGDYKLVETKASTGYVLDETPILISITYKNQNTPIVIESIARENKVIRGKIQIVKTNSTMDRVGLKDAVFGIYKRSDDTLVEQLTTDRNGFATSSYLRYGDYYIKELKAPVGYWKDEREFDFSITEHEVIEVQHIANEFIEAKIKVVKTDEETNLPIENVEFKILDSNNEIVKIQYQDGNYVKEQDTFITDENGIFILQAYLPYGTYKLVETKAPEQYLPIDPIEFTIDENQSYIDLDVIGLVLPIGVENQWKKGHIEILKIDKDTQEPIADTVFEIYDSELELIDTLTTDENGIARIENLKYGMYYVKEIQVPFPYVIDKENQLQNVFIEEHQVTYEVEFKNAETEITILKIDKDTQEPIADTVFELYDENEELIDTLTTDENGQAVIKGLEFGKYQVKEKKVPFPYVIDSTKDTQEIELTFDTNKIEVLFENVTTKINIFKIDKDTQEPIPNTVFELYDETGELIDTLTTDETGIVTVEGLEFGKYQVKEIEVPFPYVINPDNQLQELELTEENNSYDIVFKNEKAVGHITINKTDNFDEVVIGVEFSLYDENEELIDTLTTDKNGQVIFENLPLGKYIIKETKTPIGYDKIEKDIEVIIDYQDQETPIIYHEIDVMNKRTEIELQVHKIDSVSKEPLVSSEVEFEIKNIDTGEIITIKGNDKNGIAKTLLTFGRYELRESNAPKGYQKSPEVIEFEIKGNEENKEYVIVFPNDIMDEHFVKTSVSSTYYMYLMIMAVASIVMIKELKLKEN